jgi:hypothetical protein
VPALSQQQPCITAALHHSRPTPCKSHTTTTTTTTTTTHTPKNPSPSPTGVAKKKKPHHKGGDQPCDFEQGLASMFPQFQFPVLGKDKDDFGLVSDEDTMWEADDREKQGHQVGWGLLLVEDWRRVWGSTGWQSWLLAQLCICEVVLLGAVHSSWGGMAEPGAGVLQDH